MFRSAEIDKKGKTITLVLDLEDPKVRPNAKNLIIASTDGHKSTGLVLNDKKVIVKAYCFICKEN